MQQKLLVGDQDTLAIKTLQDMDAEGIFLNITKAKYNKQIADIILNSEILKAIKKNTFESVLMRWMKLEPIIQSEVSQKEKHQYSILTHIYGI